MEYMEYSKKELKRLKSRFVAAEIFIIGFWIVLISSITWLLCV